MPGKRNAPAEARSLPSESEYRAAIRKMCEVIRAGKRVPEGPGSEFDRLAQAIEDYEDARHPISEPSHAALLKHLLATKRGGLAKLTKATGIPLKVVNAILSGHREIGDEEAKALAKYFSVEPSVFSAQREVLTLTVMGLHCGTAVGIVGRFPVNSSSASKNLPPQPVAMITQLSRPQRYSGPMQRAQLRFAAACW